MRTCAIYNATIKCVGVDEVRVRTRAQRRSIIHDIVANKMVGEAINNYILSQTLKLIKEEDQEAFIRNIREDLKEINEIRIVGLGVSQDQLKSWQEAQNVT